MGHNLNETGFYQIGKTRSCKPCMLKGQHEYYIRKQQRVTDSNQEIK